MRKIAAAALAATGAAALVVGLNTPAFAATGTSCTSPNCHWSIDLTGSFTGSAGTTTLKDVNTGATLTCTSSSATVQTTAAASPPGVTHLGDLSALSFANCTGPGGFVFTVSSNLGTGTPPVTWPFDGNSYNNANFGATTGTISNVSTHISGNLGCSADVTGSQVGIYTNPDPAVGTGSLATSTSNLTVSSATAGCFGLLNNGDSATFTATYSVANGPTLINP